MHKSIFSWVHDRTAICLSLGYSSNGLHSSIGLYHCLPAKASPWSWKSVSSSPPLLPSGTAALEEPEIFDCVRSREGGPHCPEDLSTAANFEEWGPAPPGTPAIQQIWMNYWRLGEESICMITLRGKSCQRTVPMDDIQCLPVNREDIFINGCQQAPNFRTILKQAFITIEPVESIANLY